ncbi:MAG TPA: aminotransferase class I/II-fold pyridoxal phosphate-dependent enzyme, partial [Longimicrobiales bacterium]|nr:aminotransferase class I/II-fold pyridoxal phosphate-dependent enzyme [Longimicrobiales bacterium]
MDSAGVPLEARLAERLDELERLGLRRTGEPMARLPGRLVQIGDRMLIDFASNDYLGLATDPRLADAAARAMVENGTGSGASRLITGSHPLHLQLEEAMARFTGEPAALLFNSGYAANTGAIPALAGAGDIIYSDELNH